MPTDCPASEAYDWDVELKSKDAAIRACAAFQELGEALTQPFKSFMESDIKDYYPTHAVSGSDRLIWLCTSFTWISNHKPAQP